MPPTKGTLLSSTVMTAPLLTCHEASRTLRRFKSQTERQKQNWNGQALYLKSFIFCSFLSTMDFLC